MTAAYRKAKERDRRRSEGEREVRVWLKRDEVESLEALAEAADLTPGETIRVLIAQRLVK